MPLKPNQLKLALVSLATLFFSVGCATTGQSGSQWAGTWELKDPQTQDTVTVILSEDGKAYIDSPLAAEEQVQYLQLPLERVSDESALPENAQVVTLEELAEQSMGAARQNEGQNSLAALARAQQAYFLENQAFAQSLDALQLGLPSETENYQYEIVSANSEQAYMTATAKMEDLKSFSTLVYADNSSDTLTSQVVFCATDEASTTAPAKPAISESGGNCPNGSSQL
ncbi:type IV pilin-like G/H family protein [Spirulina sp. CS-785/01]|uniref:type IV pilin-like G/H family protein n=1 Tax=Spirulina sp. CS-785/01 TaxID=3021716 RepID=UPI00232F2DD5|nr:type IV pilin-like G/H family protein [Spirulina sp. CS-785/01]MDB9314563.1 type IV pilin-like G/H family protein [Spirulina sp. CS-785/01]